jgi:hypothetical protein
MSFVSTLKRGCSFSLIWAMIKNGADIGRLVNNNVIYMCYILASVILLAVMI